MGASDPRLWDRAWLERTYAQHGDMWIALELGVDRKTVRRARERHGIMSAAPGRRRGSAVGQQIVVAPAPRSDPALDRALLARARDRKDRTAGSLSLLGERALNLHRAERAGDEAAVEDALADVASVALLALEHRMRLRGAL
ncbi:MAG: hypothetical protein ACYCQK_01770 [Acidiferrobacteraceae bacterium]